MQRLGSWHLRWLGTGLGERTRSLGKGLNWILPSSIFSRVLCGLATIAAARWMGPEKFGEGNLVLAVTFYIQIPLFCGITTAISHYVPQSSSAEKQEWTVEGLQTLLVCGALTLLFGHAGGRQFSTWCGVTRQEFDLALIWCAGYALYTMGSTAFIALERFKARALMEITFSIIFPISIAFSRYFHLINGRTYVMSLTVAYGLAGLGGLALFIRDFFHTRVKPAHLKKLFAYGLLAALGSLASALMQSPARLILHRYLGLEKVGILSAYQSGSVQTALFFLAAFVQVFFPISSRTPNKVLLFKKLQRVASLSLPFATLFLAITLTLYMTFLGTAYTSSMLLILLFSLAAAFTLYQGVFMWFLASTGTSGQAINIVLGLLTGAINVIGCKTLIPRYSISGAAIAMIGASAAGIALCYLPGIRKYVERVPTTSPTH